jgi:O-antigen ligase
MGVYLLMLILAISGLVGMAAPWFGSLAAYLIAVLNPQSIWWWNFEGLRPVYWVLLPTLIGVMIGLARGQLKLAALANWRIFWILTLLLSCVLSTLWGPFSLSDPSLGTRSAAFMLENLFKIVLLLLAASICVDNERRLSAMAWMFVATGAYLTFWINDHYLGGGVYGRVAGPRSIDGSGAYTDENIFGTLFVAAIPFLWFMGMATQRTWLKYVLWFVVPFAWHGVFLTGSRGALLATGAAMLLIAIRSRKKWLGAALIAAFIGAFIWQAGDTMKERISSVDDYEEDASASGRLDAWQASIRMMAANPLTGVGPGAFVRAFSSYSEAFPLQAHNTFFQFGGEFGPLGALSYLMMVVSCLVPLWRVGRRLKEAGLGDRPIWFVTEATLASLVGVFTSALFLSFQLFEPLYFLIFMSNVSVFLANQELARVAPEPEEPQPLSFTARAARLADEPKGREEWDRGNPLGMPARVDGRIDPAAPPSRKG